MHATISRRRLLLASLALGVPGFALASAKKTLIEVWKSPYCGCCKDWVSYLEKEGFAVKVNEVDDRVRSRLGMPERYTSCHTARVGGYLIEGHVPAADIRRLLVEKPKGIGLAVPGMPIGSPGMDGPAYGGRRDPYNVLLVVRDGVHAIYTEYR